MYYTEERNQYGGRTMSLIREIKEQVLQGNQIAKAEALQLYGEPLEELCLAADEIRYQFCGN